ncbi:MAG: hypothetical protein JW932_18845 [Deltaproteobacteria bacterium]|nr:hypothetical protein [Deltaproteobacteria bacterium]
MISPSQDIREFIRAIEDKDYLSMIYLADDEATAVERSLYHTDAYPDKKKTESEKYANQLKSFIAFLRYSIKPHTSDPESDYQLFQSVLEPGEA